MIVVFGDLEQADTQPKCDLTVDEEEMRERI